MLYLWAGTLNADALAMAWANIGQEILPYVALGLMLVGFGFKVSAAPSTSLHPMPMHGASSPLPDCWPRPARRCMVGLFRTGLLVIALPEGTEGSPCGSCSLVCSLPSR